MIPKYHRLLAWVAKRIVPEDDVDDVVQEAWLRAYAARERIRPDENPMSYLCTITRRLAYNLNRNRRRQVSLNQPHLERRIEDGRPGPEQVYEASVRRRLARGLVARAGTPLRQEAIRLRYLEELEYPDVAHRLGMDERNVRQTVYRGLRSAARASRKLVEVIA